MVGGTGWSVHFDPTNRLNSCPQRKTFFGVAVHACNSTMGQLLPFPSSHNEWHRLERAHKFKFCPRVAFLAQMSTASFQFLFLVLLGVYQISFYGPYSSP